MRQPGLALASVVPEARLQIRGPGATRTLSNREIFSRPLDFSLPQRLPIRRARRSTPAGPQEGWHLGPAGPMLQPCLPNPAGPEPAGGLWPRGDHPHQCRRLPHPVSGPVHPVQGAGPMPGWSSGRRSDKSLTSPEQDVEMKRKRQVHRSRPGALGLRSLSVACFVEARCLVCISE